MVTSVVAPSTATARDTVECRPDRLHRVGYAVFANLVFVGAIVSFAAGMPARNSFILLGGAVLTALVALDRWQSRLVVSDDGVTVRGLFRTHAPWDQIGSYRLRDTTNFWEPSGLDIVLWPFVLVFRYVIALPIRAVVRLLVPAGDRRFLDHEFILLDRAGKKLLAIDGGDRYSNVATAIAEIVERFHALPPPPFAIEGVSLDAIAALEVGKTTKVTTSMGTKELATDDIPNLYLVIDAVRSRGGRVDVDVFVP